MTTESNSTPNVALSEPTLTLAGLKSQTLANRLPTEIVQDILLHVPRFARAQTLHSCCLVNRRWHHLAMRRLWQSVVLNERNLELFAVGANLLGTEGRMGPTLSVRGVKYMADAYWRLRRPTPLLAALSNPLFNNLQFLGTRAQMEESDLQLIFTVCQNLVAISCWVHLNPDLAGFSDLESFRAAVSKLRVLDVICSVTEYDDFDRAVDDFINLCAANVGNSLESWTVNRKGIAGPDVFPNIPCSSLRDYDCQDYCFDSAIELESFLLNHGTQLIRFGFDDFSDEESNVSCSIPILSRLLEAAPNLKHLAQCQLQTEWLDLLARGPHLYSLAFGDPLAEENRGFSPDSLFNYLQQRGQSLRHLFLSYAPPCLESDDYLQIVLDCCPNLETFRTGAEISDIPPGAGDGPQSGPEGGPVDGELEGAADGGPRNGVTEAGMRHFLETAGARLRRVGCCWNHNLSSGWCIESEEAAARFREVAARKGVDLICSLGVRSPTYFDLVWEEALGV
ncbi:hypothetical protein HK104_001311 [Borealophlyctis nickersoniae]|nr:hypothetical protein HK104_001311 [Borealophlyctis nickersoniae]